MPRRIRLQRRRRRGAHPPSRQRRAWFRLCTRAHHEERHVRARGCERKPARGDKIQRLGRTPRLDQHSSKRRTSRGFLACAQHRWSIARTNEDEAIRGEAEFGDAWRIDVARLDTSKILTHPDNRTRLRCPHGEHDGKARSRRLIRRPRRKNLVQRTPTEPALQHCIKLRRARRKAIGRDRRRAPL